MKVASFEKREWIDPWRDRRPMTDDPVLVTFWRGGKMYVDVAWYREERHYDTTTYEEGWVACGTVLAWMPLPDPYNPVEEEELLEDARNAAMDAVAAFIDSREAEEDE